MAVTSSPQPEATRPESAAAPVPALVARTVAIDDPGALLSLLPATIGPDRVTSWVRRGEGLVGWGRALEFRSSGSGRFAEAQAWWRSVVDHAVVRDDVHLPGTGPLAFGSFSFSADSPAGAMLVVPGRCTSSRTTAWSTTDRHQACASAKRAGPPARNPRARPQPTSPSPWRTHDETCSGPMALGSNDSKAPGSSIVTVRATSVGTGAAGDSGRVGSDCGKEVTNV